MIHERSTLHHPFQDIFTTIFVIVSYFVLTSCNSSTIDSQLHQLDVSCSEALRNGDIPTCDSLATLLFERATAIKSRHYLAQAHYYLGTYRTYPEHQHAYYWNHLDTASQLVDDNNSHLKSRVANARALWELRYLNFPMSLLYFEEALQHASTAKDARMQYAIEANLSELYRLMGDTIGFAYSKQLMEKATKNNYEELRQSSAVACAFYLSEHEADSTQLHHYLSIIDDNLTHYPWTNLIRAQYLTNIGNYAQADSIIDDLLPQTKEFIMPIFLKARIKAGLGQLMESNNWAKKCLEMYQSVNQDNNWPRLHFLMASNYRQLNQSDSAYLHLLRYAEASDSISSSKSSNDIKAWKIKYEVEKKERMIEGIRSENQRWQLLVALIVSVLIVTVTAFILYIHSRNKHYRRIVDQSTEAIKRENQLIRQLNELTLKEEKKDEKSSMSSEKMDDIFSKITSKMDSDRIWADQGMTRETFADIIGCNRTYFSSVIKEKTGLSYTQYINKRRIHEAIRIMTDSQSEPTFEQLSKTVGFQSESNFYAVFRQIMGMTPAAFRKISKEKTM